MSAIDAFVRAYLIFDTAYGTYVAFLLFLEYYVLLCSADVQDITADGVDIHKAVQRGVLGYEDDPVKHFVTVFQRELHVALEVLTVGECNARSSQGKFQRKILDLYDLSPKSLIKKIIFENRLIIEYNKSYDEADYRTDRRDEFA